jgi:hypothetical protein
MTTNLTHDQNIGQLAECWSQISQKIQEMKYENAHQFIEDTVPVVNLLNSHKKSALENLRVLLNLDKPLSQISPFKCTINGSQLLSNVLSQETVPHTIMHLFHRGQLAGIHASRTTPKVPLNPSMAPPASLKQKPVFKRDLQSPPLSCCLPHEDYYGVWRNPLTGACVAQVVSSPHFLTHCR